MKPELGGLATFGCEAAECLAAHREAEILVAIKLRNRRDVRAGFPPAEESRTELNSVVSRMQTFERAAVNAVSALAAWAGEP